ncbi:MAG: glycosyltransferase, partial [Verrucomicrobiota bacterium]
MSSEKDDLPISLRLPLTLIWVGIACAIIFIAGAKVDQQTQIMMAVIVVGMLFVLRWFDGSEIPRVVFLTLAGFLVVRYLIWRTMTTLTFHDTVSFSIAIALYLAELFGVLSFFLGIFVNIRPKRNAPEPLPEDTSIWPTVDVYIPTYDESIRVLENTVHAAVQMKYPKDRFKVFLLDDGGTVQKLNQSDPVKSKTAANRVRELKELCEATGATYRTREKNEHAKAGNLNAAFHETDGELILILDADHVPAQDFLVNTTGRFLTNPKLFLVQTPHFALNPDPIEKNLRTFAHMPSEQEMFYNQVQFGIDSWGSSSFCGSAAVLRRSCLEEVGGICGETITEDAETSIELHSRGYESEYFGRPMIAGLAPQTLQAFIVQRSRWAVG